MALEDRDFKEYDTYKDIKEGAKILKKIMRDKPMFNSIYYWDCSSSKIMIESDIENYNPEEHKQKIDNLKKINEIFKKGYLNKDTLNDSKIFEQLKEYITLAAFRYSLIKRKPFILLQIKYKKLDEFEIKCIFEYIIHTDLYLNASKHKDPIAFVKLGWWTLKDIINKYKPIVEKGNSEYDFEGDYQW